MVARLVEVELVPGEEPVLVEVTGAGGGDVALSDRLRLDEAGAMVQSVGRWAAEHGRGALPEPPDEFEVSFGIKIGLKSGKLVGILAEASGEASLNIKMTWKKSV